MVEGRPRQKNSPILIVGVVVLLGFLLMIFNPFHCHDGRVARKAASISNLRYILVAHEMYLTDFDGFGPSPATWADQLAPYTKNEHVFRSLHIEGPMEERKEKFGFAYFRPLGEVKEWAVQNPEEVPLAFDSSDLRWNANGDLSLLPDPPRWDGRNIIAFLDGHAKATEGAPKVEIKLP